MKIFIDANILVSVLNKEYPLFQYTARIISLADRNDFTIYTSPICLAIAFYFAEKKTGARKAKTKIELACRKIQVAAVTGESVQQALNNKKILDFEDGLEYYAALTMDCDYIITEDVDDFHFSSIKVCRAKDFFDQVLPSVY